MYYISRVEVDIENRKKISDLTHLGAYHNWVEKSFPNEIKKEERIRKLWRIDQLNGRKYLLIVSPEKPNISQLELYGVAGTGKSKPYDPFLQSLRKDQKMFFRLTANPVRSVKQEGKRGRVYPHVTAEQQLNYLEERANKLGFDLVKENYQIVDRDFVILKKKGGKNIRLARASYEGSLIINDVELFRETLVEGIGKEKAYGFGLMTVLP